MSLIAVPYFMGDQMEGFDVPEPHDVLDTDLPAGTPQERMAMLYDTLADRISTTSHPVVYAGDCVSTIGVLAGLERRRVHPTVVFFDAHGDFNTWETTPSGFIGGMPLAMLTGRGEQTIVDGARLTPVPDERIVLVDARDLDSGEDAALARSSVAVATVHDVMSAIPNEGPLYVHVDLDVVDPADMPAMNYPAPNGPSLQAVQTAVRRLSNTGRVVAFSISSWNPDLPGAKVAAVAAARIATPFLAWSRSPEA